MVTNACVPLVSLAGTASRLSLPAVVPHVNTMGHVWMARQATSVFVMSTTQGTTVKHRELLPRVSNVYHVIGDLQITKEYNDYS